MNYLITIIGPTAIGKTSLSIALAQHFNCEIISCDSRQFFKEMNIGTAVPTTLELALVPHHFIQNKSIFDTYNVGDFEKEAITKLDSLFQKNNIQIMVGGSGLYVNAVLKGMDEFPEVDEKIRNQIQNNLEQFGIEYLQKKLKELDPKYYDFLLKNNEQTLKNPQRMMRFVEVCVSSGKPYSSFLNLKKNNRSYTPIIIGLEANREIMYERINTRVDSMMQEGLLDEAIQLLPQKKLNALQTVGYRELFDHLEGKISLDFAIDEIKKNTRRFAKRQLTWFKSTENAVWFDYLTDEEKVINYINSIV
jgi:tRNA dimethylallyltransferase